MTTEEIIKYINKFARQNRLTDEFKSGVMENVVDKYKSAHTFFGQSRMSKSKAAEFKADGLVNLKWLNFMDYFQNKKHIGKTLHTTIKKELEKHILDAEISSRYETKHSNGTFMHRTQVVKNTVFKSLSDNDDPLFGAVFCVGSILASPLLLMSGLIHASTRKPLNIAKQQFLFANLERINAISVKESIINRINQFYIKDKFFNQSETSSTLSKELKNDTLSIEEKWDLIVGYLKVRDDDCLKNNGKALFNVINDIVNCHAPGPTNTPPIIRF